MAETRNPYHNHPLKLQHPLNEYDLYCHGCDRHTVDDKGPFFKCLGKLCPFNLHKSCASLPKQIISHSFHPNHTLTLLSRPPHNRESFQCDACLKNNGGFTFHCADCNFNLDVCCSQLIPKEIVNENNGFDGKSHSWIICNSNDKFKVLCSACKLPVENPIYVCLECKLLMHKSCTQLPKSIRHPFHKPHSLLLTRWVGNEGNGFCSVCWDVLDDSIGYSCDECKFKLDKKCASLVAKTYEFHDHPLVLVPTLSIFNCHRCECGKCVPMLHCIDEDCGFNLHLHCIPSLPSVVNYEGHIHPLTLTNTQIKDHDDEEGYEEFYCDACEELRLLPDPTYYCEECHYVAHVRCLISDEEVLALGKELVDLSLDVSISTEGSVEEGLSKESDNYNGFPTTKLEKEIKSVILEIESLTAKLEGLKRERVHASRVLAAYHENRRANPDSSFNGIAGGYDSRKMGDEDDSFGSRTYCIFCRQIIPPQRGPLYCRLDINCTFSPHTTPGRLLKSCAKLPPQISHPSHPQHPLSLLSRPPYASSSFTCDSCKNTGLHFVYHCADCKFDLDVLCASLLPSQGGGGDDETTAGSHLGLDGTTLHSWNVYSRHEKFEVLCSACRSPIESQICVCLECKVFMHKSCTLLPTKIMHPLHSLHPLSLFKWDSFYPSDDGSREQPCEGCWGKRGRCIACGDGLEGNYVYQCLDCQIKIDIKCSFLTPKTYDFHDHPLVLVNTSSFDCNYCQCKDCSPMLRSVNNCDYNVHLHCVPSLPQTVVRKHVHPLKLADYPIKDYDDEADDVELYCDACEELRPLNDPTYYCHECHYVSHVRCAISDEDLLELGKDLPSVSELNDESEGNSIDMTNKGGAEVIRTKGNIMHERLVRNCKDLDHQIESVQLRLQELASKLEALNLEQSRVIQSSPNPPPNVNVC
ncbi:uncharacterized protein LOC124928968 [Impatiens glandulifera]|uniref:uncharacterized protein LOC124928968 n=1 Tax=Impatiens glandulifera TaxID=253017 RepID=UPI001FB0EC30|nr:uncharacterized protein LOC124928968 [Impatiens glandulifera]